MSCRGTGSALADLARHKAPTNTCVLYLCLLWTFFFGRGGEAVSEREGSDGLKIHCCALHQITFWPVLAPVSANVIEWRTHGRWDPAVLCHSVQLKRPQEEILFCAVSPWWFLNKHSLLGIKKGFQHWYFKNPEGYFESPFFLDSSEKCCRSFMSMYGTYTVRNMLKSLAGFILGIKE